MKLPSCFNYFWCIHLNLILADIELEKRMTKGGLNPSAARRLKGPSPPPPTSASVVKGGGEGRDISGDVPFKGGPAGHATQQHPFEGSKQQAGSIHKPCPLLKTNHCAKRDWVVASVSPSVTPFQRARQQQPAWAKPAPFLLYPRDTHCNKITESAELFRAAPSVSFIINMQIAPGSQLPNLQQPSPSRIWHWLLSACCFPGLDGRICL